jgi:hypothetical protein
MATTAPHSYNGSSRVQWTFTATTVLHGYHAPHSYNSPSLLQWSLMATTVPRSYNGPSRVQWTFMATTAPHSYNGPSWVQWTFTATKSPCNYNSPSWLQWPLIATAAPHAHYANCYYFLTLFYRLWLCTFTTAVSAGAVLLLPISIVSNEVLLLYPKSYYVKWLNSSLIHGKFTILQETK